MIGRNGAFEFEAGGRTYSCRVEESHGGRAESRWWWFDVSGDDNRYAPFRAEPDDTVESVRERIVEYYERHIAPRDPNWRPARINTPAGQPQS